MKFSSEITSVLPLKVERANYLFPIQRVLCTFYQFVIFKPLSYCFEERIGFDVKASFASRPESRLIR